MPVYFLVFLWFNATPNVFKKLQGVCSPSSRCSFSLTLFDFGLNCCGNQVKPIQSVVTNICAMPDFPTFSNLPSPPSCVFASRPSLVSGVSDHVLGTFLPTLVYIVANAVFHVISKLDLLSRYRIHPTNDELRRNHVSRSRCLRGVIRYHIMQIALGLLLICGSETEKVGNHQCGVDEWAVTISRIRGVMSGILALAGIDACRLSLAIGQAPVLCRFFGRNQDEVGRQRTPSMPAFSDAELALASFMTSVVVPATQFLIALAVVDTWVYFTHRVCHVNKTLYRMSLRSLS